MALIIFSYAYWSFVFLCRDVTLGLMPIFVIEFLSFFFNIRLYELFGSNLYRCEVTWSRYEKEISHRGKICMYIYAEVIELQGVFRNNSHLGRFRCKFS